MMSNYTKQISTYIIRVFLPIMKHLRSTLNKPGYFTVYFETDTPLRESVPIPFQRVGSEQENPSPVSYVISPI